MKNPLQTIVTRTLIVMGCLPSALAAPRVLPPTPSLDAAILRSDRNGGQRRWDRVHVLLRDANGTQVAEYTHLLGLPTRQLPCLIRILYKDQAGHQLVMRHVVDKTKGSFSNSYKLMATGETLTLAGETGTDSVTASLKNETVTFSDDGRTSPAVRGQLAALMSSATAEFKDALRGLTVIGSSHVLDFLADAKVLEELFFYDEAALASQVGTLSATHDPGTMRFDPERTPPSEFDQQFGDDARE